MKFFVSNPDVVGSSEGELTTYVPPNTKYYNIFVLGAINSGKTSFIKASSKNINCLSTNVQLERDLEIPVLLKPYFTNIVTT